MDSHQMSHHFIFNTPRLSSLKDCIRSLSSQPKVPFPDLSRFDGSRMHVFRGQNRVHVRSVWRSMLFTKNLKILSFGQFPVFRWWQLRYFFYFQPEAWGKPTNQVSILNCHLELCFIHSGHMFIEHPHWRKSWPMLLLAVTGAGADIWKLVSAYTSIAMENPPFECCLPWKMAILDGCVS